MDCLPRREVVAVGAGERVPVALVQHAGALVAGVVDEGVAEIVRPGARGGCEPRLDLGHVVVGHRPRLGVDDVVEPRQHGFGDAGGVVGALAPERLLEDLLDLAPVLGVEPLAWDEDEAGEEAPEDVAADEEPDAAALAEVEDAERELEQLVRGDLEELVAGIRLEDLDHGLVVVAPGQPGRSGRARSGPSLQQRDLPGARAVDRVGEEAEKTSLRRDLAVGAEPLHADVVEVGRAGARSTASSPWSGSAASF